MLDTSKLRTIIYIYPIEQIFGLTPGLRGLTGTPRPLMSYNADCVWMGSEVPMCYDTPSRVKRAQLCVPINALDVLEGPLHLHWIPLGETL